MKRELGYDFEPTLRGALGSLELLHVISKAGGSAEGLTVDLKVWKFF